MKYNLIFNFCGSCHENGLSAKRRHRKRTPFSESEVKFVA